MLKSGRLGPAPFPLVEESGEYVPVARSTQDTSHGRNASRIRPSLHELRHRANQKPRSLNETQKVLQSVVDEPSLLIPGESPLAPLYEFRIDRMNLVHPALKRLIEAVILSSTTTSAVSSDDYALATEVLGELLPQLVIERHRLLPAKVIESGARIAASPPLAPISRGNRRKDLRNALQLFFPRNLG